MEKLTGVTNTNSMMLCTTYEYHLPGTRTPGMYLRVPPTWYSYTRYVPGTWYCCTYKVLVLTVHMYDASTSVS